MPAPVRKLPGGFLVQEARIDLDHLAAVGAAATDSSYTEASPLPGAPEPQDERSSFLVQVHHGQDADVRAVVLRPQAPGVDGAGVGYREETEADTSVRGWSEPNWVHSFDFVEASTTEDWFSADAVTIPESGKVVVVACDQEVTSRLQPSVWIRDGATRTWSVRAVLNAVAPIADHCALVQLPSGRLVVYLCTGATVDAYFSDDEGETWSEYTPLNPFGAAGLPAAVDHLRVVVDRYGALMALATDGGTGDWWMYRSEDDGLTFDAAFDGSARFEYPSLARLADGQILCAYRDTNNDPYFVVIPDAYTEPPAGAALDGATNIHTIRAAVDDDGIAYIVWARENSDLVRLARSTNDGETFELYTHHPISAGGAANPTNKRVWLLAATFAGGELVVCWNSQQAGTAPSSDGGLLCFSLGGWSSVENGEAGGTRLTRFSLGSTVLGSVELASVFFATEELQDQDWVQTGAAHDRPGGPWRWNPVAATSFHTLAFSWLTGKKAFVFEGWRCVSGGSQTDDSCSLDHHQDLVLADYRVVLRASTTGFVARDVNAAADFGAAVVIDMTTAIDVMLYYFDDNDVTVFYKRRADSVWTKGPQKTNLANAGAGAVGNVNRLRLGCQTATTTTMRLTMVGWTHGDLFTGLAHDSGYINRLRWGKALSPRPYPVRDQGGAEVLRLSANGGAPRFQEVTRIPKRADYGVRHLFPQESPAPASRWRSEDLAEQSIVIDLEEDSRLGNAWALGLCLLGANFRTAYLEVRASAAGAWTTLGTWDAAVATSLSYTRSGNLLVPGSSGTVASYWRPGHWRGGHVLIDPSGTPKPRRILWNSGGGWGPGLPSVIRLEGIDGTEPSNGTMHLVVGSGVLVVHPSAPTAYRRVRLRIPAQDCPDPYFELGQMVLGSMVVPGRQWSRGFSWRMDPNTAVEIDEQGTAWPTQLGDVLRELTVAWQDGANQGVFRGNPSPPVIAAGPGLPVMGTSHDVQGAVEAMVRLTEGWRLPIVGISKIPRESGMVLNPDLFLYGIGQGRVQTNHVQGEEGRNEIVRVESIVVRGQPQERVGT